MPIKAAVRVVVALFREFEQSARTGGMSMPQYRLLLFLRRGPRRAGELAALAEVKKPSVTPMIAALEANGWIARAADQTDRRSARLTITDAGKAAMDIFETRLGDVLLDFIPDSARDTVVPALEVISTALNATREQRFSDLEGELLDAPDVEAQTS